MAPDSKKKLLTVEDTFSIEGRGVLVLPMFTDYTGPMSFSAVLRKPSGDETTVRAHLDFPRINPPRKPYPIVCSLEGVSKQDVPVGTEIWIHEPAA
jgi:hypothetical protein